MFTLAGCCYCSRERLRGDRPRNLSLPSSPSQPGADDDSQTRQTLESPRDDVTNLTRFSSLGDLRMRPSSALAAARISARRPIPIISARRTNQINVIVSSGTRRRLLSPFPACVYICTQGAWQPDTRVGELMKRALLNLRLLRAPSLVSTPRVAPKNCWQHMFISIITDVINLAHRRIAPLPSYASQVNCASYSRDHHGPPAER